MVHAEGDVIRVVRRAFDRMLVYARYQPKVECCGLLAGRDSLISEILPAANALRSATAYEIAPEELFTLFRQIRATGMQLLGIYHSHPSGENFPSQDDMERAFYPEAAYFILSPLPEAPRPVRAFRIANGQCRELRVQPV